MKSLKKEQDLSLGTWTQKHLELSGALDDHIQELAMFLVYFNLIKMCIVYFK
jgi:phosphate starvation-inducible membrane PsiE